MESKDLSFRELTASIDIASLHPEGKKATETLLERLDVRADDYVLDVGCGTARDLVGLVLRKKCRAVGIDRSRKMVEMARDRVNKYGLSDRITILRSDAHNLPLGDEKFDVAYIQSVLLQLEKNKAIGELARVLKPGGRYGSLEFAWDDEPDAAMRYEYNER